MNVATTEIELDDASPLTFKNSLLAEVWLYDNAMPMPNSLLIHHSFPADRLQLNSSSCELTLSPKAQISV